MGPGEAKPMPGPRARYHLERVRESVWDVVAAGALKIKYGELKKGLDENKEVSWVSSHASFDPSQKNPTTQIRPPQSLTSSPTPTPTPNRPQERTGLDGAKVRRAVTLECQSNDGIGHQTLCTFDDFHALACRHGAPTDAGIDPVLTTQQYMEAHKLVPLLESMTAAVMTAKPEDPKKFLEQTLRDYAFRDVPVLGYDDKDLDAVFTQYDITRSGKITREQCDAAMIAMTGHKAKSGAESSDPVTKAEFMQLAREGLNTFTA